MLHTCCWWILKDKRYLMFSKIFFYFCFLLLITCLFRMFWHGVLCDIFITLSHIDSFSFCCLEICLCSFGICHFFAVLKNPLCLLAPPAFLMMTMTIETFVLFSIVSSWLIYSTVIFDGSINDSCHWPFSLIHFSYGKWVWDLFKILTACNLFSEGSVSLCQKRLPWSLRPFRTILSVMWLSFCSLSTCKYSYWSLYAFIGTGKALQHQRYST